MGQIKHDQNKPIWLYRINHSELFADKQNHINGIKNFWKRDSSENNPVNYFPVEHQKASQKIQWYPKRTLPPVSKGVRMEVQLQTGCKSQHNIAKVVLQVKTQNLARQDPT
jgi:hypothetical protein